MNGITFDIKVQNGYQVFCASCGDMETYDEFLSEFTNNLAEKSSLINEPTELEEPCPKCGSNIFHLVGAYRIEDIKI